MDVIEIAGKAGGAADVWINGQKQERVRHAAMSWDDDECCFTFVIETDNENYELERRTFTHFSLTYHVAPHQLDLPEVKPFAAMSIGELQRVCHLRSFSAGWWDDYHAMPRQYRKYFLASRYALIHSEGSEAFEGLRKGKMDDHLPHRRSEEVELADLLIRIFDYAGAMEFDLIAAIEEKLAYNAQRHDHTQEARAAEGGKQL